MSAEASAGGGVPGVPGVPGIPGVPGVLGVVGVGPGRGHRLGGVRVRLVEVPVDVHLGA
jgi:hypothetical protein